MNNEKISIDSQLDSIQTMLTTGHQAIHLERHTLPLWGISIGLLTAFTYDLTRPLYNLGHVWGKSFEIGLVFFTLLAVVWLDYRLTRKARSRRDEAISIIQRKVTYVIWMLFAFAFMLDLYANMNLGGGRTMFGVHLVLSGIILLMFGLYSVPWYRWAGVMLVLSGLGIMFLLQPSNTTRLLTASIFMIGGIGVTVFQPFAKNRLRCLLLSIAWLSSALLVAVFMYKIDYAIDISPEEQTKMTWSDYQALKPDGKHIVSLDAGSQIPLRISVKGDVFEDVANASLMLKTSAQIDLEFKDGKPTGIYRIGNGQWLVINDAMYLRHFSRKTIFDKPQGPELVRNYELGAQRQTGALLDW